MSTHRCSVTLFPYPITATDDGAQYSGLPEDGYYVDLDAAE